MISSRATSPWGAHQRQHKWLHSLGGRLPWVIALLTGRAGPEPQSQTDSHSVRPALGRNPRYGGHLGSSFPSTPPGSGFCGHRPLRCTATDLQGKTQPALRYALLSARTEPSQFHPMPLSPTLYSMRMARLELGLKTYWNQSQLLGPARWLSG